MTCNHRQEFTHWEDHSQPIWCCQCEIEKLKAALWQYESGEREALQQLAACRALLREIYAKAVRNKHNIHWHEVTLTDDQMAAILKAAGGEVEG